MDIQLANQIAKGLLEVGAIKLRPENPFTWSSGWKSPIYCDNRVTLSDHKLRSLIKNGLAEVIKNNFPQVEAIGGVATAGIPQGALVADILELPYLYVRPKPKDHGMQNLIEGKIVEGQKVLLIEDLISTGGSSLKAAQVLIDSNMEPIGMVAIFTYGFKAAVDNFKESKLPLFTLSNYDILIDVASRLGQINQDQVETLKNWRITPEKWGV